MIEWLPIVGYENSYEVSNDGRVRTNGHRTDGRIFPAKELAQHKQVGYPYVSLYRGRKGKGIAVHRLVLEAFVGHRPEEQECNHKNGIKHDNRLENLEWVTRAENQRHAVKLGLRPRRTKGAFKKGGKPWNAGKKTGQVPWNYIADRHCLECGKEDSYFCRQMCEDCYRRWRYQHECNVLKSHDLLSDPSSPSR